MFVIIFVCKLYQMGVVGWVAVCVVVGFVVVKLNFMDRYGKLNIFS